MSDTLHSEPATLEAPAPPRRSRRRLWLVVGGVLVALLTAAGTALFTRSSGPQLTTDEAESEIRAILVDTMQGFNPMIPVQPTDVKVSCPETLPGEPEQTFTCEVTVPGAYEPLDGTIKAFVNKEGKVEWCTVAGEGWSMFNANALVGDVCAKDDSGAAR